MIGHSLFGVRQIFLARSAMDMDRPLECEVTSGIVSGSLVRVTSKRRPAAAGRSALPTPPTPLVQGLISCVASVSWELISAALLVVSELRNSGREPDATFVANQQ